MRFLPAVFALIILSSCANRISTASLIQEADSERVQLMRVESEVYGDFFKLRIFHQDLLQVVNKIEASPYPELDTLYHQLFNEANDAVLQRILYDSAYKKIQAACSDKKHISRKGANGALILEYDNAKKNLPITQSGYRENYFSLRKMYQDICQRDKIYRLDPQQYAQLIDDKMIMWQDSLEEVGRMIAREKNDLKKRFPEQKGPVFFAAYRPVSEHEAMLKNFESILNQLQNSLSRFEEGNREDFIYFGPYVRIRIEVQATDDLIGQLAILMKDCRSKEKEYWSQLK